MCGEVSALPSYVITLSSYSDRHLVSLVYQMAMHNQGLRPSYFYICRPGEQEVSQCAIEAHLR